MKPRQFIAQLTAGGGPDALHELESLARLADASDGRAWLGTRALGRALDLSEDSRCVAFAREPGGGVLALEGRILSRAADMPALGDYQDLYDGYRYPVWWELSEVGLVRHPSLSALPGRSRTGLSADRTFSGSCSFAYWRGLSTSDEERPPLPAPRRGLRTEGPRLPLHGVDFSGGREKNGRNPKLWLASWLPDGRVTLEWGGGPEGFGREALARRIARSPGLWLLDFPFGPEAAMAQAMGWRRWEDYLRWARSDPDATRLRDAARRAALARGLRWSQRRRVDALTGTTWFPFFEQLYRQTLRGAADVLAALAEAGPERVRVLPWHAPDEGAAQVIEGFPGLSIKRLGLAPAGYKGKTGRHRAHRAAILEALIAAGVPCGPEVGSAALEDPEGDALDALVLLFSAAAAARRAPSDWHEVRERGAREGWGVEGWFFD